MAIKQTNIFPIDKQPQKAVGIAYPFSAFAVSGSSTPFKSNYTTQEQIKSNLTVFFVTNPGERYLNPNYGGGLYKILFEQLTDNTYDIVYKQITDSLNTYFPNVDLKSLEILENPDGNEMKVVMSYSVFNNEDTLEITLNG
jgi:phage baseplate assembly protein W